MSNLLRVGTGDRAGPGLRNRSSLLPRQAADTMQPVATTGTFMTQAAQLIRTIVHMSPAVSVAALMTAQRRGQNLQAWLDRVVVDACAANSDSADSHAGALTDDMTLQLFAHVASQSPGLLTGRWRLLFERVLQEQDLWVYPAPTMADVEDGIDSAEPYLSQARLREAWPRLLASSFAM